MWLGTVSSMHLLVFAIRFNEPSAATKVGNRLTGSGSTNFLNDTFRV